MKGRLTATAQCHWASSTVISWPISSSRGTAHHHTVAGQRCYAPQQIRSWNDRDGSDATELAEPTRPLMSAMPPIATARYVTGLLNLSVLLSPICQRRAQFYECSVGISDCCCFVSAEIVGRAFHIDDRALQFPNSRSNPWMICRLLRIVCAWHIAVLPQVSTTPVTSEIRNLFISFSMLQCRASLAVVSRHA